MRCPGQGWPAQWSGVEVHCAVASELALAPRHPGHTVMGQHDRQSYVLCFLQGGRRRRIARAITRHCGRVPRVTVTATAIRNAKRNGRNPYCGLHLPKIATPPQRSRRKPDCVRLIVRCEGGWLGFAWEKEPPGGGWPGGMANFRRFAPHQDGRRPAREQRNAALGGGSNANPNGASSPMANVDRARSE